MLATLLISLLGVALMAAILFGAAGRLDLPTFWTYLGVWLAVQIVALPLARRHPTLLRERLRPGPGGQDTILGWLLSAVFLAHLVVAGLDAGRYHWSDGVPPGLRLLGLVGISGGCGLMIWAVWVNRFFSSVVRIQTDRGHALVTGGPYRHIRHPGYLGGILIGLGSALALGSWLAAIPMLGWAPLLVRRTLLEERLLLIGLAGYSDYCQQVRFRILPGVW